MTEQRHSVVSQRMPSPALAVEACVSQSRMHRDTVPNPPRRERDNETDEANLDASGASNSSSDTLSGVKAPALTQDASPVSLNNHSRRSTDRSSSSSSSSSSLLSSSHSNAGPYETPLTAALASQDHSAKLSRPLTEPGYPFPQIPATSDLAERPNASSTRKHSDDLWKHTDDLLGPSNRSASGQSASKPGPSTLSLSKPDASADGDVQHTSLSQATTPTAADMDRRDSQSSSSSSRSVNQQKSTASQSGYPGAVAVKQSSSSNSLAKLSSSSSPVGSSGMASFSPLSPLVQPFSPSANAANLPNKSAAMPKATPLTNASGRLTQPQSSTSIQTFSEGSATAQTVHSAVGHQQRRQATGDSLLEASTTSSSGDTGYFSAYAPTRSANPSSATDIQRSGGLPDLYKRSLVLDHVQPVETGRQRYWSGEEALAMSAATVGTGGDSYNLDPPQLTTHGSWPQAHGNSGSEGLFSYEDPRLGSHTNTYVGPMPSGHSVSHQNAISLAQSGMPSMRGAESFDAGLYGYGPASVSDISTAGGEEICTIFVVGFPEDIQEREFQNMFLFARGFEAATLKIPASTAAARERDAAAAAAVSAIAATLPAFSAPPPPPALDPKHGYGSGISSAGGSSYDHLNNSLYEETFRAAGSGGSGQAQHGQLENAQRVSSALAAAALSATASTASLANTTNKKQIIGFAKFRSRDDAMVARDVLSGRKIDPEKGCVLKAEMAKKNLHVKKAGTEIQGSSLSSLAAEANLPAQREGASALDKLAERERQREWHARMTAMGAGHQPETNSYRVNDTAVQDWERTRDPKQEIVSRTAAWPDPAYHAFHSVPVENSVTSNRSVSDRRFSTASTSNLPVSENFADQGSHTLSTLAPSASDASSIPGQRIPPGTSNFGKTLLQQLDDPDDSNFPLPDPHPGFGAAAYASATGENSSRRQPPPAALPSSAVNVGIGSFGGHTYLDEDYRRLASNSNQNEERSLQRAMHQYADVQSYSQFQGANATTPTSATTQLGGISQRFTSPDLVSPTFTEFRQPRTQNRADDNMPISTLYVGGLPSSLPSLPGSVSASQLEDALRNVFARCPGFRRMSYRHKSQGPMCFIEFDDTQHATRALNEIYGHTLGGLVKGGIRLAYSKNPLGVRGSGSNGPESPTPLSPGYFASDVYSQASYYGSPSAAAGQTQIHAPTLGPRSAHYDQGSPFPHTFSDYASPPASHQASSANQQVYQSHPSQLQQVSDQRRALDRRATSPQSGPGSGFSPFAMRP